MDWVDAWKAVSVVLTGVFGMLGLLTEFKHPETKQITRWGRVSLAGIILSSAAGFAAQLKETSEKQQESLENSRRALALSEKTDRAITELQRVLTPIGEPKFSFMFTLDCKQPNHQDFCNRVKKSATTFKSDPRLTPDQAEESIWHQLARTRAIEQSLNTSVVPVDRMDAMTAWPATLGTKYNLSIAFTRKDPSTHERPDLLFGVDVRLNGIDTDVWVVPERDVIMFVVEGAVTSRQSNGRIVSVRDLPGVLLQITATFGVDLTLYKFRMDTKEGRTMSLDRELAKSGSGFLAVYELKIPETSVN